MEALTIHANVVALHLPGVIDTVRGRLHPMLLEVEPVLTIERMIAAMTETVFAATIMPDMMNTSVVFRLQM